MPLMEKMKMFGWIVGAFGLVGVFIHFEAALKQRNAIESNIELWRNAYHLNEGQCLQIRKMERDYHGSGDPFFTPNHSSGDKEAHHRAMASIMNPEDGERFLKADQGPTLSP